jgi:hypothetical protein
MWKEKYEALKQQFDLLTARLAQAGITGLGVVPGVVEAPSRNGEAVDGNGNMDFIYRHVRDRLSADLRTGKLDGALLQLLSQQPEIRVNVKRHTLEMSDDSTDGRIALLISQKFFDAPQDSGTLTKEFKRRGWFEAKTSNAAVLKPLAKITEMGFLLREGTMYQAVPGMKINIVEA